MATVVCDYLGNAVPLVCQHPRLVFSDYVLIFLNMGYFEEGGTHIGEWLRNCQFVKD
jgi:hypothetical protein